MRLCLSPAVHTADTWEGGPTDATKGCALALAWESDPEKLTPEDFVVITTNRTCPFYARTAFDIPSDLPAWCVALARSRARHSVLCRLLPDTRAAALEVPMEAAMPFGVGSTAQVPREVSITLRACPGPAAPRLRSASRAPAAPSLTPTPPFHSAGSSFQMYLTFFRARITGATQTDPLPSPRVARRCKDTPELCVKGPKRCAAGPSLLERSSARKPSLTSRLFAFLITARTTGACPTVSTR